MQIAQPRHANDDTILIVDDDFQQAQELADFFVSSGIPAEISTDAADAIARIEAGCPRLVLLDISMPGFDGLDVVRIVRNLNYAGAILLMTGYLDAEVRAYQEQPNVLAVLTKPVPFEMLEHYARCRLGLPSRDASS